MTKKPKQTLPEETIQALIQLGTVLRPILDRQIADGKAKVVDDKIIWKKDAINTRTKGNTA
ncbi:MAG: hypothetical protein NTZ36_03585 [Candidatus Jorgensenbacteria bacterium]|nr:hypothetical protein [Candidatus Jorgensenbacteria bacterium]